MSSLVVSFEPAAVPAPAARTVVHKFGGTSVADAERYRHVAQLLLAREETVQVTVVSAMKGVTDALIELAELAAQDRPSGAIAGMKRGRAIAVRQWRCWANIPGQR